MPTLPVATVERPSGSIALDSGPFDFRSCPTDWARTRYTIDHNSVFTRGIRQVHEFDNVIPCFMDARRRLRVEIASFRFIWRMATVRRVADSNTCRRAKKKTLNAIRFVLFTFVVS
jgi:hypothetical protein